MNGNNTVGGTIPFPWKDGKFGGGSIVGGDSFPASVSRPAGAGPDSRKGRWHFDHQVHV